MFTNFVRWMDRTDLDIGIVGYSLLVAIVALVFGVGHMFDELTLSASVIFLFIMHSITWIVPTMILVVDAFIKHGFGWVTDGEIAKKDFIFDHFSTHITNDRFFTLIAIFGSFALAIDIIVGAFMFPVVLIPLGMVGFVVLVMYVARMAWRVKSRLTNHVTDPDAHNRK